MHYHIDNINPFTKKNKQILHKLIISEVPPTLATLSVGTEFQHALWETYSNHTIPACKGLKQKNTINTFKSHHPLMQQP